MQRVSGVYTCYGERISAFSHRNRPLRIVSPDIDKHLIVFIFIGKIKSVLRYHTLEFGFGARCILTCCDMHIVQIIRSELIIFVITNRFIMPFDILAGHFPYAISTRTAIWSDMIVGITGSASPPPGGTYCGGVVLHEFCIVWDTVINMCMSGKNMYFVELAQQVNQLLPIACTESWQRTVCSRCIVYLNMCGDDDRSGGIYCGQVFFEPTELLV